MAWGEGFYAIVHGSQSRQLAAVQAGLNLCEDGGQLLEVELDTPYNMSLVVFRTLDSGFPQPSKMWAVLRNEFPDNIVGGAGIRDCTLRLLLLN